MLLGDDAGESPLIFVSVHKYHICQDKMDCGNGHKIGSVLPPFESSSDQW